MEKMHRQTHFLWVTVPLMAAFTAIGGWMIIPFVPVPFTLQTFFVYLAGGLFNAKTGALSQSVLILAGLAGFPVFAQGGGPAYILHYTFGYIAAFPAASFLVGKIYKNNKDSLSLAAGLAAGMIVILLAGSFYLFINLNFIANTGITLKAAVFGGMLIFLPSEFIKGGLAFIIIRRIKPLIFQGEL